MFNAEETISRCLTSLLNTTVPIKVVCVDDGSLDRTREIVRAISENDSRVVYVAQENKGAGSARNKGIEIAETDYIMFCDADDQYAENVLQNIWDCIIRFNNPDMIVFKRANIYRDGHKVSVSARSETRMLECRWDEYINSYFIYEGHSVSVINKVYKRNIILEEHVQFPENMQLSEDLYFNLQYLPHCNTFVEDFKSEYLRYLQDNSLTRRSLSDYYNIETRAIKLFQSDYPQYYSKIERFISHSICNAAVQACIRLALKVDGDSIIHRLKLMHKVMHIPEVRKSVENLDCSKESKEFLDRTKLIEENKALLFYLKYGSVYRIKRFILRRTK